MGINDFRQYPLHGRGAVYPAACSSGECFENVPVHRGALHTLSRSVRGFLSNAKKKERKREKEKKKNERERQRERERKVKRESSERVYGCSRVAQFTAVPCVFSLPNETVVILWLASALERYTTVGMERLGRIAKQQYRPLSDARARAPPVCVAIFASPPEAES